MTDQEADEMDWEGVDGLIAHDRMRRRAFDGSDIEAMMAAWLRANTKAAVLAERETCAKICEFEGGGNGELSSELGTAAALLCARQIRARSTL